MSSDLRGITHREATLFGYAEEENNHGQRREKGMVVVACGFIDSPQLCKVFARQNPPCSL